MNQTFTVTVNGEPLSIPDRIYNPPNSPVRPSSAPPLSELIEACIYSRHHDGFVRQQSLRTLLKSETQWVAPFVVRLIGEYVIEIVDDIHQGLDLRPGSDAQRRYGRFVADNPSFVELTAQRVISYWNCYHRFIYPVMNPGPGSGFDLYPGFAVIADLRRAAADVEE